MACLPVQLEDCLQEPGDDGYINVQISVPRNPNNYCRGSQVLSLGRYPDERRAREVLTHFLLDVYNDPRSHTDPVHCANIMITVLRTRNKALEEENALLRTWGRPRGVSPSVEKEPLLPEKVITQEGVFSEESGWSTHVGGADY